MTDIPKSQYAVQLVGPDELILNKAKDVPVPGPHQILCRVEAVGLCKGLVAEAKRTPP